MTYSNLLDYDEDEDEAPEPLPTYTNPRYIQFVEDMESAGFTVEHYDGRFSYEGPAVRTDEDDRHADMQAVIRATDVPVQWDNMGLDMIVYPR